MNNDEADFLQKIKQYEVQTTPKFVYQQLENRFASLIFTLPHLDVPLPENVSLEPSDGGISIKLQNNGKFQTVKWRPNELEGRDWSVRTNIESIVWKGKEYSGEFIMDNLDRLLDAFFLELFGDQNLVDVTIESNENAGLGKGTYLYRAISESEYQRLIKNGYVEVSYLDPSANFENQEMFDNPQSQAKFYAQDLESGYSGKIIRWKIKHPLLYRKAGMVPPRVVPLVSHYLPKEIEISEDGGESFVSI